MEWKDEIIGSDMTVWNFLLGMYVLMLIGVMPAYVSYLKGYEEGAGLTRKELLGAVAHPATVLMGAILVPIFFLCAVAYYILPGSSSSILPVWKRAGLLDGKRHFND